MIEIIQIKDHIHHVSKDGDLVGVIIRFGRFYTYRDIDDKEGDSLIHEEDCHQLVQQVKAKFNS